MRAQGIDPQTLQTEQQVREAVQWWKGCLPYRNWCAVELPDGWQIHDSVRSAKAAARKANVTSCKLLSYGRD